MIAVWSSKLKKNWLISEKWTVKNTLQKKRIFNLKRSIFLALRVPRGAVAAGDARFTSLLYWHKPIAAYYVPRRYASGESRRLATSEAFARFCATRYRDRWLMIVSGRYRAFTSIFRKPILLWWERYFRLWQLLRWNGKKEKNNALKFNYKFYIKSLCKWRTSEF